MTTSCIQTNATFFHSPLTMLASDGTQYTYKSDPYGRVAVRSSSPFFQIPYHVSPSATHSHEPSYYPWFLAHPSSRLSTFIHFSHPLLRRLLTHLHRSPSSIAPPTHPHLIPPLAWYNHKSGSDSPSNSSDAYLAFVPEVEHIRTEVLAGMLVVQGVIFGRHTSNVSSTGTHYSTGVPTLTTGGL
jgi:hypothetical protein